MVGFASFLLIFLVVQYEQSFDNFHTNKNNIYRIVRNGKGKLNGEYRVGVPFPVSPALRSELPQLKNVAAIFGVSDVQVNVMAADGSILKKFKEPHVCMAEPQFFQMFDFGLAEGNIKTALNEPNEVLLTKDVADKYFGNWKDAMNKTISLFGWNLKVTGILNNPPVNTDFPISVVASFSSLMQIVDKNDWESISDWNYCFVQLNNNTQIAEVNKLLAAFVDKHIRPVNPRYDLALQPLNEMHYDRRYENFTGRVFSKDLTLALKLIGLFLLIIACVNFINLTTAQAVNRSREVGVRKVLGSARTQLILQFLGETAITTLLALTGAIIIATVCIPFINRLLEMQLSTSILYTASSLLFIAGCLIIVTLLAGIYPALILSGFKPAIVLKSGLVKNSTKGVIFRRSLVVFQFIIAQVLIIGTLVVVSQMNYFKNADLGFTKDAVINVGFPGDSLSRTKIDFLRNELIKMPGVRDISFSSFSPSGGGGHYTDLRTENNHDAAAPDMIVSMKPADTAYFKIYNFTLVAGRVYFSSDTMREYVVNETVVKTLGIRNPADAIGKRVNVDGKTFPIVGVVKDFNENSLREPIRPLVLTTIKDAYGLANIKIDMSQAKSLVANIKNLWDKYFPDQRIAEYYKQEDQLSQLYKIFSGIAIFISCLGLYGLTSFMAIQRKKEIGIRKVLGAPVRDIVVMLSKEFTILILIAFLIASPIAWYYMHQWLQQYTYRIMIGVGFFLATIICSLLIAWVTVGYTTIKAAIANPVKSLRTE